MVRISFFCCAGGMTVQGPIFPHRFAGVYEESEETWREFFRKLKKRGVEKIFLEYRMLIRASRRP
ncbi:MAG: hypothetical protein ACE5KJ_03005 [Candidatus Zixiibacteriota bacterium]